MFMWLALHGKILTNESIRRLGMDANGIFSFMWDRGGDSGPFFKELRKSQKVLVAISLFEPKKRFLLLTRKNWIEMHIY